MQKARLFLTLLMLFGLLTASVFIVNYFNTDMDDIPTKNPDGKEILQEDRERLLNKKRTANIIALSIGLVVAFYSGNRLKKIQQKMNEQHEGQTP